MKLSTLLLSLPVLVSTGCDSMTEESSISEEESGAVYASKKGDQSACVTAIDALVAHSRTVSVAVRTVRKECRAGDPAACEVGFAPLNESMVLLSEARVLALTSCAPVPSPPSVEVCDGVDNNGDGEIDEGFSYCAAGFPAPNTDGAVCDSGYLDSDGDAGNGCEVDTNFPWYEAVEVSCDGLDNDRDGQVDEGCAPSDSRDMP